MSGELIGIVVPWLIVAVIAIAVAAYLMNWLYRRSSKELAFVRTGFGGERVVIDGAAFVIPILHEVTDVNMNVLQLRVVRDNDEALITRDRMRVDVEADFYVRVAADKRSVAAAASTLGRRTLEPERLYALLDGKLVAALRTAAAAMTMEEMHERRGDYVARVRDTIVDALAHNGLVLETVAIITLDQTELGYFSPSNRFDAEGLTALIQETEGRRKLRNDIEQDTMIQIRMRNLQAEKQALDIEREAEMARLAQERDIETRRAEQRAEVARERAAREALAQQAQITAQEQVERARIENEQSVAAARIASDSDIRRLEIDLKRALEQAEITAHEETERSRIEHDVALTRARIAGDLEAQRIDIEKAASLEETSVNARLVTEQARLASERVLDEARIGRELDLHRLEIGRERGVEEAGIERHVAVYTKSLELHAAQVRAEAARALAAEAEERVATVRELESVNRRRQAELVMAEKEADETRIVAAAAQFRSQIEAEAQRLLNEAENVLTDASRMSIFRRQLLEKAEGIIRETVRPIEKIDGIRIVQFDGLAGGRSDGDRSLTDEVIDSALRYRVQAPMVDGILKDIGFEGGSLAKMGGLVRDARDIESIRKDVERRTPDKEPDGGSQS